MMVSTVLSWRRSLFVADVFVIAPFSIGFVVSKVRVPSQISTAATGTKERQLNDNRMTLRLLPFDCCVTTSFAVALSLSSSPQEHGGCDDSSHVTAHSYNRCFVRL